MDFNPIHRFPNPTPDLIITMIFLSIFLKGYELYFKKV